MIRIIMKKQLTDSMNAIPKMTNLRGKQAWWVNTQTKFVLSIVMYYRNQMIQTNGEGEVIEKEKVNYQKIL